MFLNRLPEKSTGKTLLLFVEGYRENGKVKQRKIETLGYLEDLTGEGPGQFPDPIAHFKAVAKQRTKEKALTPTRLTYTVDAGKPIDSGTQNRMNIGYTPLSQLYHTLELPRFFANRQRNLKIDYSLNAVFSLLVYARILAPASKKRTFELKDQFFERFDFSLDDVYHGLSRFATYADALKSFLHQQIQKQYGRKTQLVYYDVTNYYFEIDEQDTLRRKGVSKEHRPNPIVQMGLLMDSKGLPVSYELFSGNTNDCLTLMPILQKVRQDYDIGRFIVVADRGLNTSDNTAMAMVKGDGYIYGQSILKANAEMKAYCLKQEGYTEYIRKSQGDPSSPKQGGQASQGTKATDATAAPQGSEETVSFRIKSRIAPRTLHLTDVHGKAFDINVDEKQIFFYSEKYAQRSKAKRQEVLAKSQALVDSPARYENTTHYGAAKYVTRLDCDTETGEIIEPHLILLLDENKIDEEASFDGYYVVVTSELDMDEQEVIDHYRGLWKIEESFRLTKSELEARPVYVSREDHIQAHFLSCFVALLLLRLLEQKTSHAYPAGQLIEAMRKMNGSILQDQTYLFDYYTPVVEHLGKTFDLDYNRKFFNKNEILKMRKPR